MSDNSIESFGTQAEETPAFSPQTSRDRRPVSIQSIAEEDNMGRIRPTQWTLNGHDTYVCVPDTVSKLPAAMYTVQPQQDGGIQFDKQQLNVDELINFPDSKVDALIRDIDHFWTKGVADRFKQHNFLHRRGFIFHGPPGSGKTCVVQQLVKRIIDAEGIVFLCEKPVLLKMGLKQFRQIEPDRPVICVFEDIDAIIKEEGEEEILSLLDGENQIDRVFNIATTNFPEYLPKRIVARCRRFDRIIQIDWPGQLMREYYFKQKLGIVEKELKRWVDATDGLSFASCAELVISVKCLDKDFEETAAILKEQNRAKASSTQYNTNESTPGFGAGFGK